MAHCHAGELTRYDLSSAPLRLLISRAEINRQRFEQHVKLFVRHPRVREEAGKRGIAICAVSEQRRNDVSFGPCG